MRLAELRGEFYEAISSFNLPIYRQGSMSEKQKYPECFITYFLPTVGGHFGENKEQLKTFTVEVAVYSDDIDVMDDKAEQIKEIMESKDYNFVLGGEVASDTPTHTGYMQRFVKTV